MDHLIATLANRFSALLARHHELRERMREDDGQVTTEMVIIIALVVILAVTVGTIISTRVIAKAKGIAF